jgi:hypothetical protein
LNLYLLSNLDQRGAAGQVYRACAAGAEQLFEGGDCYFTEGVEGKDFGDWEVYRDELLWVGGEVV